MTRSVEIPDAAVTKALSAFVEHRVDTKESRMAAALVAARPYLMPTREQIAEALHDNDHAHSWRQEGVCSRYACEYVYPPMADVVLALLNGPCTCPTDADVTPEMRDETGQHLTGCPMSVS